MTLCEAHVGVKVLKESEKDVLRDDENYRLRDVNRVQLLSVAEKLTRRIFFQSPSNDCYGCLSPRATRLWLTIIIQL